MQALRLGLSKTETRLMIFFIAINENCFNGKTSSQIQVFLIPNQCFNLLTFIRNFLGKEDM